MSTTSFAMGVPIRVSFEFFPPGDAAMEATLWKSVERLAPLAPRFVSVTYGADGSTRERTHNLVTRIQRETSLVGAPHLTCVGASRGEILDIARKYWDQGVRHLVALRGDPPQGQTTWHRIRTDSPMRPTWSRVWRVLAISIFRSPRIPRGIRRRRRRSSIWITSSAKSTRARPGRSRNSFLIPMSSCASAIVARLRGFTRRSCRGFCRSPAFPRLYDSRTAAARVFLTG